MLIKYVVLCSCCLLYTGNTFAQQTHIPFHKKLHVFHSGKLNGTQAKVAKKFTKRIKSSGAAWLQLRFSDYAFGNNSYLTIRSLKDGGEQRLDKRTMTHWKKTTAYFNGDEVEITLHVAPDDEGVFFSLQEIVVGEQSLIAPASLCGLADDRQSSSDARIGRILPVGCTGWIISNGANLSAGHCAGDSMLIYQFNVPPSEPDGTINNPPPEDQYLIDTSSVKFFNDGTTEIGNDWAVFYAFANTETGLTPVQAQGDFFRLSKDVSPNMVRVTGYGLDNMPVGSSGAGNEDNQTQQSHAGIFLGEKIQGNSDVVLEYQVDTLSANSGSPVIDAEGSLAIGIHTNGGCSISGGNLGTGFENDDLEMAIQNAPGLNMVYLDKGHPDMVNNGTIMQPASDLDSAINLVNPGNTLSIVSGSYAVNATLDKAITIVAPVGTVVLGK